MSFWGKISANVSWLGVSWGFGKPNVSIKKQRIIELSKPEEGQNSYIIIGYICAILGGLLGLFIGWHLLTYKKTLPNGSQVYAYSENDRKQGNRIVILGGIFLVLWILYRILK